MNAAPDETVAGWRARLELGFQADDTRTRLAHRLHHGPLMVQRAFYPEGPVCHVYVIHPPGGVVSGDELSLQVQLTPRAHAVLTTPAAGKFYRRHGLRTARFTQSLVIDGATLEWLPQENIYYPDANAVLATRVQLHGDARFLGWEIGCFGLPARGLGLADGCIQTRLELWRDEQPLLLERALIDREMVQARWGLAGRSAFGTLLAHPAGILSLEQARSVVESLGGDPELLLACTLIDNTLCCRGYAARADRLKYAFTEIWSRLRMGLLGRAAMPPRIWKT
jgi:urease accessory protein